MNEESLKAEDGCECLACSADGAHASSCAVHNGPTLPAGPCDCRAKQGLPVVMMGSQERARAWAMIADKDAEIERVKAKNLALYRKISDLATDAYDLTVRAEAAEDQLKLLSSVGAAS